MRSLVIGFTLLVGAGASCSSADELADPPQPAPETTAETTQEIPPAADGSNLSACRDGQCEVRVEQRATIPVDPRFGLGELRVESLTEDAAAFRIELTRASSMRTDCPSKRPSCGSINVRSGSDTAPAGLHGQASTGYRLFLSGLTIDIVTVEHGTAVLRLSHPQALDGGALTACRDGTCAVRVTGPATIPISPRFGLANRIRVNAILPDAVDLSVPVEGRMPITVSCGPRSLPTCPTTAVNGVVDSRLAVAGELQFPRLVIRVAAVDQGSAVLRVKPA